MGQTSFPFVMIYLLQYDQNSVLIKKYNMTHSKRLVKEYQDYWLWDKRLRIVGYLLWTVSIGYFALRILTTHYR